MIVTIFLPLLLVVMTHSKLLFPIFDISFHKDYWIDTMQYFEQPQVKHLNELIVYMYTDDGAYTFGSTKNLNNLIQGSTEDSSTLSPQFTILNHDVNNDGKVDQLEIKI